MTIRQDRLRAAVRNPPAAAPRHPALGDDARALGRTAAAQRPRQQPLVVPEVRVAVPVRARRVEYRHARLRRGLDRQKRPLLLAILVRRQPHAAETDAELRSVQPTRAAQDEERTLSIATPPFVPTDDDYRGGHMPTARSRAQRRADALRRLCEDVDLWVASADETGAAYLIPLSYYWDGSTLTVATPRASRTARNLTRAGWARVALGRTRDVLIVEGAVEAIPIGTDAGLEDAHARATGFDPRALADEYVYLRITPREMQAWRESNELPGRRLMRAGEWLDDTAAAPEPEDPAASA